MKTITIDEKITVDEWFEKGKSLFGPDREDWRWKCPLCGHTASSKEYLDAGAPEGAIGYSCIGRFLDKPKPAFVKGPGPCDYAGGGLFEFNPITIIDHNQRDHHYFEFGEPK